MRMRKTLSAGIVAAASLAAMAVAPEAHAGFPFPWQCDYTNFSTDFVFNGDSGFSSNETYCMGDTYELAMQQDGNFVLYNRVGDAIWASGTWNHSYAYAMFQTDGNLVVYAPESGPALWATGTYGNPGSTFAFQQDGNLVIYGPSHQVLWASGTYGR